VRYKALAHLVDLEQQSIAGACLSSSLDPVNVSDCQIISNNLALLTNFCCELVPALPVILFNKDSSVNDSSSEGVNYNCGSDVRTGLSEYLTMHSSCTQARLA
jgi:hypothetical protein